MVQINDATCLGITICSTMAVVGYLGGQTVQLIIPTASAVGYGLTLGLWGPASLGMYAIAEVINRQGGPINAIFAFMGGYVASWMITNLMGYSVSMIAPFMGVTTLVVFTSIIATVAAPVFICCCGSAAVGMGALRN